MKTLLCMRKWDADGRLVEKRSQVSTSWLKHFVELLYSIYAGVDHILNDIDGVSRTVYTTKASDYYSTLSLSGVPGRFTVVAVIHRSSAPYLTINTANPFKGDKIGIVIGTGAGAVTPTQDSLQTRIVHGSGAGQMLYAGTEILEPVFINPNGSVDIRRFFENVSGGGITVEEIGIYAVGVTGVTSAHPFCIARDVVAPGITVNNGEILEVKYIPQITV